MFTINAASVTTTAARGRAVPCPRRSQSRIVACVPSCQIAAPFGTVPASIVVLVLVVPVVLVTAPTCGQDTPVPLMILVWTRRIGPNEPVDTIDPQIRSRHHENDAPMHVPKRLVDSEAVQTSKIWSKPLTTIRTVIDVGTTFTNDVKMLPTVP
jgi:hypothetical protein